MSVLELPNPSGVCQCGCGEKTTRARETNRRRGMVKGEYQRYAKSHGPNRNMSASRLTPPNPSGLCWCGCLGVTELAKSTDVQRALIMGEHRRYVAGHRNRGSTRTARRFREPGPNPNGLCMCGCEQKTRPARRTNPARGDVAGTPQRYVRGHQNYGREHLAKHRQAKTAAAIERWRPIIEDYRSGLAYEEMASKHDISMRALSYAIARWRELVDPDLPYRKTPSVSRIIKRLEREGRVSKKAAAGAKVTQLPNRGSDAEREAEIAALVAEQEDDAENGNFVAANGTISLDKPIADGGSLHELLRKAA